MTAAFVVALLVAACAGMAARPLPPKVEVEGVSFVAGAGGEARVRVRLDVSNPNPYAIAVRSIEAAIRVEDQAVATAGLAQPVLLAASGSTRVEIEARPDFAALREALNRMLRRLAGSYEVAGFAIVQEGVRLDFRRRGELALADLLGKLR